MFQRLEELQTGSLYILTGQAGAGKSHLAASARRAGSIWVLDTEGAAQNLVGKAGLHRRIQAVQTISLRSLVEAMAEIRQQGKPGDTIILDSISKIFQAMRAYAQQRAGSETDRKTNVAFDEHASVNRNMQVVYTGLTELKQAGFHVIIIGHLGRKYRAGDQGLHDDGLRVLADDQIAYEADAILLVEREGDQRTITPIIKPPRPAHLQAERKYPATIATLYPDLAANPKGRKGSKEAASEEPSAEAEPSTPSASELPTMPAERSRASGPPRDSAEAERRFYMRYGAVVGGESWSAVQRFLGATRPQPNSIEEWIAAAEAVRDRARADTVIAA